MPGTLDVGITEDEVVTLQAPVDDGEAHGLPGHQDDRGGIEAVVAHDDRHVTRRLRGAGLRDRDIRRSLRRALHADEHQHGGDDPEDDDHHDRRP
jgi:hypothetical protein